KLSVRAIASGLRAQLSGDFRRRVIDPRLREAIILRISAVNECPVWSMVHERLAARLGISPDEIDRAREGESDLDPRARIAFRFAEARTLDRPNEKAVAEFERAFDAREQREIRAVVDYFTFTNAFNNTWEGVLPGAARRRRELTRRAPTR
ncbi:MAG: carboxymuconolactone decarboxylase family protein, partial [Polyangiales bacterium]